MARLLQTLKMALRGLQANKVRAFLTILGIVISIAAIILMMSIGRGAEKLILDQIGGLGAETIIVRPGKEPEGPTDIGGTLFADSIKNRDVKALSRKENVPEAVEVMPMLIVPGSVSYQGETYRPNIFGGPSRVFSLSFGVFPREGRLFDDNEVRAQARVAIIGSEVKKELFGNADAVGEQIRIKDQKFRVVGVYPPKGQISFFNVDETIIIPYTAAQTYLLGIDYFHEVLVRASSPKVVDRTVRDIEATLRAMHGITDPEKDDFFVVTQQSVVEQVKTIVGALTAFLSSVVAIALVVGGIGIMNIMLVSVTERTKEIGLRKAVGATGRDILVQFLIEALLLTSIGGVIGIILGGLLSLFVAVVLSAVMGFEWSFVFPVSAVVLGAGVSAAVGLLFGLYPAREAARRSPIEALRYE